MPINRWYTLSMIVSLWPLEYTHVLYDDNVNSFHDAWFDELLVLIIIDKVSDEYDIGNAYSEWLWPGYSVIYFNDHWWFNIQLQI